MLGCYYLFSKGISRKDRQIPAHPDFIKKNRMKTYTAYTNAVTR